jgi:hypothetical protein
MCEYECWGLRQVAGCRKRVIGSTPTRAGPAYAACIGYTRYGKLLSRHGPWTPSKECRMVVAHMAQELARSMRRAAHCAQRRADATTTKLPMPVTVTAI